MALKRTLVPLLLLAALCSGWGHDAAAGTLRRANSAEPETLDPAKAAGLPELQIDLDLYEGLATYAADGGIVPGIAARWETSADGLRWTFHLRHDAKWSNGDPVTAEDFVYTLRRLFDPATAAPNAYSLTMIVNAKEILAGQQKDLARLGATAPDPSTLIIQLRQPVPYLLAALEVPALPVNRKAIEAHGPQWTRPENIVTDGPFTLAEWTPQAQIVLKRNPYYHAADQLQLDEVRWVVAEDASVSLKRYRAGELDISRVPPPDLGPADALRPDDLHETRQLAVEYLAFNLRVEPFASNPKLREALALVVDRETLNRKVSPDGQISTDSLVPPLGTDYTPQSPAYAKLAAPERLALARKLMAEAGYPPDKPLKLTVLYNTDRSIKKRLLSIAAMWKEALGVELTLQNREWQIWLSALRQGDFELAWSSAATELPDAADFLSGYRSTAGELNDAGYRNPAYDKLIDAALSEADIQVRTRLLEQAERLLLDDTALIPLDNPVARMLVSPRVTGWRDNLLGLHLSRYLGVQPAP